ncbi:membrane protein [Paucimonas lemoignei]|uniref:Membrane protein n=1 Tax=Paucimonas lemoignei TaxID=29443 RepID=A0A4R3HQ26_PAULE|nr:YihY/virulence factor BrkB family protein [Paucimonas lemoignei]TCS32610.1 membrane protein [Paucimonas lemoignei]
MKIAGFEGINPVAVLVKAVRNFLSHDMSTYAAGLAYHVLFSLFPFIIFLIALLSFFELSDFFNWLRDNTRAFLPPPAMEQVDRVIGELTLPQKGLLSFGAISALWLASQAIRAIITALNVAYDAKETRPAWKLYPLSILFTLGIAIMMMLAAGLLIVGPQAMQWLAQKVGLESLFVTLWAWLRLPVALLIASLAIALIYYVAPDVPPHIPHKFKLITPGSVLAVVIWVLASIGFSYYVQNFGNYNVTYGSIGAIIVLLLYLNLSAAALLYGAEINAIIEGHAAKVLREQHNKTHLRSAT